MLRHARSGFAALLAAGLGAPAGAQELEPGAYSPAPVNYNIAVLSSGYSSGDVAFDLYTPASDTRAVLRTFSTGFVHTYALAGRSASIAAVLPYARGDVDGVYFGERTSAHRSALADPLLRLAVNLYGVPAQSAQAFAAGAAQTVIGASMLVVAPLGAYDDARLINVGAHRWAVRPELGIRERIGRVTLEADVGLWLYGDNRDYRGGQTRSQDPIAALQLHAIYTLYPRAWLALDANYYAGGRTSVSGRTTAGEQHNSRAGVTLAVPLDAHQSLRFAYSRGARVTIGGDFSTYTLTYQYGWAAGPEARERAGR